MDVPSWKLGAMMLHAHHQNPNPTPTAQNACVSTANERFVKKTDSGLEVMVVTRGGAARPLLPTMFPSKGGSHRTSNTRIAPTTCHPLHLLPKPVTAEIMIILPLAMVTATTVVAPSVRGPPPLPGTAAFPNSSAARERTTTGSTMDAYLHVLAVLTATLVGGSMGKWRSDLPSHHAVGLSLTDCPPTTVRRQRIGLMIEVLSRRLAWLPTAKTQLVSAGIVAGVGGGPKALEGSQLVLKMHLFPISSGGLRCDVRILPFSDSNISPVTIYLSSSARESGGHPRVMHGAPLASLRKKPWS